jgi:hypothetical protein
MKAARNLLRAYFAAITLLAFGAACYVAGVASATVMAVGMIEAAR